MDATRTPAALVVGHVCLDLAPAFDGAPSLEPGALVGVGALAMSPGGCVANTGGDLAALGIAVSASADLGSDELSGPLVALLAGRGLDVSGFRRGLGSTSYSIVIQPPGHDRTFWHHVGANREFDGTHVDLAATDLLHVGYPPLLPGLLVDGGAPLERLLLRARARGIVTSIDLAVVDSPSEVSRESWRRLLARVLPLTDIITPSMDDLASALGTDWAASAMDAAADLVALGAAIAVVSNGSQGFAVATAPASRFAAAGAAVSALDSSWHGISFMVPASPVTTAATTTGAGDAATAGLLAAVLRGAEPLAAVRFAADVAAAKVSGGRVDAVALG